VSCIALKQQCDRSVFKMFGLECHFVKVPASCILSWNPVSAPLGEEVQVVPGLNVSTLQMRLPDELCENRISNNVIAVVVIVV
jgi:hypothetical protein